MTEAKPDLTSKEGQDANWPNQTHKPKDRVNGSSEEYRVPLWEHG